MSADASSYLWNSALSSSVTLSNMLVLVSSASAESVSHGNSATSNPLSASAKCNLTLSRSFSTSHIDSSSVPFIVISWVLRPAALEKSVTLRSWAHKAGPKQVYPIWVASSLLSVTPHTGIFFFSGRSVLLKISRFPVKEALAPVSMLTYLYGLQESGSV